MYFRIEASPFFERGIYADPRFPAGVSLTDGVEVAVEALGPLVFESNCDGENRPRHYMGGALPVWSAAMAAAVRAAGVTTFQLAPASISGLDGLRWDDYFAVNILGTRAVADLAKSKYLKLAEDPTGLPFLGFQELVIDSTKAREALLFRLAENPLEVLIHERALTALKAAQPEGGWGFLARPVEG